MRTFFGKTAFVGLLGVVSATFTFWVGLGCPDAPGRGHLFSDTALSHPATRDNIKMQAAPRKRGTEIGLFKSTSL